MAVAKASWELRTGLPGTLPRDGLGTVSPTTPFETETGHTGEGGKAEGGSPE